MIHLKIYSVVLAILLAAFGAILIHGRFAGDCPGKLYCLKRVSLVLPSADPGMDNSARYIRHLALSTPGSAFPDYPGQPDYLPAGMVWPPPVRFWGLTEGIQILTPKGGGQRNLP